MGGILLNHRGRRFTNELGRRDDVSQSMYAHCAEPCQALSQTEARIASAAEAEFVAAPAPVHAHLVLTAAAVAK